MSDHPDHFGVVDLSNCDLEPIHIPGSVQPHGALLALDLRTLRVVHAGGNTTGVLGVTASALLGAAASDVLRADHIHRLQALVDARRTLVRPVFAFTRDNDAFGVSDVVVHTTDGLLVLELEPRRMPVIEDALALVQGMLHHVQQSGTIQAFLEAVANQVRAVTGFDRVMVYRFAADDSGAVVAEARGEGIDSFLGFNFPASDIPRQARELYLKNWIRHIPDARYEPLPIIPPLNPLSGKPLDLSFSTLRSVSPIHRRYLMNMGVVATLSLSLVVGGRLWGLIACHHYAPRYIPHRLREACELFAEMTSSHLQMKLVETDLAAQLLSMRIHKELVDRMGREADLADGLIRFRPNLLDLVAASGVAVWIEGRFSAIGITPTQAQVEALVSWLNATDKGASFIPTACRRSMFRLAGFRRSRVVCWHYRCRGRRATT